MSSILENKEEFLHSLISPKMLEEACGEKPTIIKYNFEWLNITFLIILIIIICIFIKKNFNKIKSFLLDKNNLNKKLLVSGLIVILILSLSYILKDNYAQKQKIKKFFHHTYELNQARREYKENSKVKRYESCVQNYRESRQY